MTLYLDSSVLVAALVEDEPSHEACLQALRRRNLVAWTHALTETFATLTGGRLGVRVSPTVAAQLIGSLVPRLHLFELTADEVVEAINKAESVGARGGAMYDYLHLVAARKSAATALYTLNARHFAALARSGDPKIEVPD